MIHDAELFSVGPDEVVVTFRADEPGSVTTVVGDHEVVSDGPYHHVRVADLEPGREYSLHVEGTPPTELLPATVTTLARPSGRLLATFATANDVHFGETECGKLGTPEELGPVFRSAPGDEPYPEVMNRSVIDEMLAADFDAVIVKGDLTDRGTEEEYDAFLRAYGRLGDRLHHVRGNHDAMTTHTIASDRAPFAVTLPGAVLAVIDTVRAGSEKGMVTTAQLDWLHDLAAEATSPVLVFGHHHLWAPELDERKDNYFGINPADSEALGAVFRRHESVQGYFAGHTHRNRVRRFESARGVPTVEIACVKDYPGAWAQYSVYEGGYVQIVRRTSAPAAMAWTEATRAMFAGLYRDYALGAIGDRCFVQTV